MTEALSEIQAMLAEYEARAEARRQESADGMRELVAMLEHRLAHTSPSVVTQDLVPVAWMYEKGDTRNISPTIRWDSEFRNVNGWTETPLYPASAIEAAQIAARNEALDLDWLRVAKLAGEHGIRYRTNAALVAFLGALLTPLQQEEK